ncbi:response regulator transcription factor [Micromonospora sp. KC721]|uniref:response regulator transcription factor n=1 Tax=Micromonospora sp. KC721 TaxID=2530380 RepID=UPI001050EAB7|nr:response regulator transcription factor [Micromonospora sp. KC721]TDB77746.1 response regulator transcription factor [Micromonospora sp. KC721]
MNDTRNERGPIPADGDHRPVVRVAVVAQRGLLRTAVAAVLSSAPGFELTGEATPGPDVATVVAGRPNLLVVDLDAVDDPSTLTRGPDPVPAGCALVGLTARHTPRTLRRALRAGVRGVISTDVPPQELIGQLRAIAGGQRMLDQQAALAALDAAVNPLSERERQVAIAAARGWPARDIAAHLHLAPGTVRNLLSALLRKTGSRTRWEAVQRARDAGWI